MDFLFLFYFYLINWPKDSYYYFNNILFLQQQVTAILSPDSVNTPFYSPLFGVAFFFLLKTKKIIIIINQKKRENLNKIEITGKTGVIQHGCINSEASLSLEENQGLIENLKTSGVKFVILKTLRSIYNF